MKYSKNTILTIRIVVGFYLLYLDYSILSDWQNVKESNRFIIMTFVIVFAVFALVLIALSVKTLIKNKNNPMNEAENDQKENNEVIQIETEEIEPEEIEPEDIPEEDKREENKIEVEKTEDNK